MVPKSLSMQFMAALAGFLLASLASQVQAAPITIDDVYFGAKPPSGYGDVVSNVGDDRFEITSMTIAKVGNNLSIDIATNYSGANVGALNTNAGALFLGQLGNLDYNGVADPNYLNDMYFNGSTGDKDRFSHVLDFNSNPNTGPTNPNGSNTAANDSPAVQSGGATLYELNALATDVVLSNHPTGGFRKYQPVDIYDSFKDDADTGLTGTWGTTTGHFTFIIKGFFEEGNLLGEADGIYSTGLTLAWAMTCANDIFMAQFIWPKGNPPQVPLPAGMLLLLSGVAGLGVMGSLKGRKKA